MEDNILDLVSSVACKLLEWGEMKEDSWPEFTKATGVTHGKVFAIINGLDKKEETLKRLQALDGPHGRTLIEVLKHR